MTAADFCGLPLCWRLKGSREVKDRTSMWTQSVPFQTSLDLPWWHSLVTNSRKAMWHLTLFEKCGLTAIVTAVHQPFRDWQRQEGAADTQMVSVMFRGCKSAWGLVVKENMPLPSGEIISHMLLILVRVWLFNCQLSSEETFFDFSLAIYIACMLPSCLESLMNVMREVLSVCQPWDPPHCKNKSLNSQSHWMVFT